MNQPRKTFLLTLAFCLAVTALSFVLLAVIVPGTIGQPSAWSAAAILFAFLFWCARTDRIDAPILQKPATSGRRLCARQLSLSLLPPADVCDSGLVIVKIRRTSIDSGLSPQERSPALAHLQALLPPGATLLLVDCPGAPSGSQCFDVYLDSASGAKLIYLNPLLVPLFPTCQLDGATRILVPFSGKTWHGGTLLVRALAVRVWGEQAEATYPFELE